MSPMIEKIQVLAYRIPTDVPESDGTLKWQETTLVVVQVFCDGEIGTGYTYGHEACCGYIASKLSPCVLGLSPMDVSAIWQTMHAQVRNDGHQGLSAMSRSAVDNALWDLKAKLLGVSVSQLLGRVREYDDDVYGSDE